MPNFFLSFFYLFIALSLSTSDALKIPFRKRSEGGIAPFKSVKSLLSSDQTNGNSALQNIKDLRYVTNITLNGVQVPVLLDTGSSDLWVIPPGGLGQFDNTGIPLDLLFGDGTVTKVSGTIGVAPFEFGSYSVAQQSFLNATEASLGDVEELGIFGLLGLGIDLASTSSIEAKIQATDGANSVLGQTVLTNIFQQSTDTQSQFIAIDLSRTGDLEETDGGSFTIGEVVPNFQNVLQQPVLPQNPVGGDRWTILLQGVLVDGQAIDVVSTTDTVPPGQSVALLDTGNEGGNFPTPMIDAIYSSIPGAALNDGPGGGDNRFWVIPCNTTTIVEITFGNQKYPIHPLDLSTITKVFTIDGQPHVSCTSLLKATDTSGSLGFDIALGDSFLRNVYSVFNFGGEAADGTTQAPFIQLLSKTVPDQAATEVATIRGQTLANLPPELDPATFVARNNSIMIPTAQPNGTVPLPSSLSISNIQTPTLVPWSSPSGSPGGPSSAVKSGSSPQKSSELTVLVLLIGVSIWSFISF